MRILVFLIIALLSRGVHAQRMHVYNDSNQVWSFSLKNIESVSFLLNDTLIPPKATTSIEISGNLDTVTGPWFGPVHSEQAYWRIYDLDSNLAVATVDYFKSGRNSWSWTLSDTLQDEYSQIWNTGVIAIDNDGNILRSETTDGMTWAYGMKAVNGSTSIVIELPPTGINVLHDTYAMTWAAIQGVLPSVFPFVYEPDVYDIPVAIYDSLGHTYTAYVRLDHDPDPWCYSCDTITNECSDCYTWHWSFNAVRSNNTYLADSCFSGYGEIHIYDGAPHYECIQTEPIVINPGNGVPPIRITELDLSDCTESDQPFSLNYVRQNGYPAGGE